MATGIKVGGTWKTLQNVSVKVSGAWKSSTNAYIKIGGVWKKWFTGLIADTFTRTTSTSLGTTDTGATWVATRGTWYANGSKAQSDGTASSYPLATVATGNTNATTSVSVVAGTGAAFWVVDSNNWWAAIYFSNQTSYTYSCTTCSACTICATCTVTSSYNPPYPCDCTSGGTGGGSYATSTCDTYTCSSGSSCYGSMCCDSGGTILGSATCSHYTTTISCYDCTTTSTVTSCTTCGTTASTCCSTGTCTGTTTNYYLRLIKCVAGTITLSPTSDVSLTAAPAALAVTTNGDSITVQAYSNDSLTTTLGSALTYTPTTPNKGTNTGIIKGVSDYNQGSTVDNFATHP